MYRERLRGILTPAERKIFARLTSPSKIQDFLDSLSINFEMNGETYMSPRRVLKNNKAHCFEGALVAAAAFAYHGKKSLLLDLQTVPNDEDHVVALFRQNGLWGAVSKTNHAMLRYRDPIYKTVRELAMSYFHEYIDDDGHKSMRAFSAPFDLSRFSPKKWVIAEDELDWLVEALDSSRHSPIVSAKIVRTLRRASRVEIKAMQVVEQKPPRSFRARANS